MGHRIQIVLSDPVASQLQELAAGSGEPPSTIAGRMVRSAVSEAARDGRVRRLRVAQTHGRPSRAERPAWLEPYGGDERWRRETWGSVVALHARYPDMLEAIKDGWWTNEAQTEILCALATWRAQIDDAAESPREELAFHRELADYAEALRRQAGGVAGAWVPGAPPTEWLSES